MNPSAIVIACICFFVAGVVAGAFGQDPSQTRQGAEAFFRWLGPLIATLFPWPLVVILAVLTFLPRLRLDLVKNGQRIAALTPFLAVLCIGITFALGYLASEYLRLPLVRNYHYIAVTSWAGGLIASLFPWGFLLLLPFAIPSARHTISRLLQSLVDFSHHLASIPLRASEVELWSFKAKQNPDQAKTVIRAQVEAVQRQFDERVFKAVNNLGIASLFSSFFAQHLRPLVKAGKLAQNDYYRATIHVEDRLYPESLYQLLDYESNQAAARRGRSRRKSVRFGIIGRAWRLRRLDYDFRVDSRTDSLVEKWGMTTAEARDAGKGQQSFLALPLPKESPFYIIFMDATPQDCLGIEGKEMSQIGEQLIKAADEILTPQLRSLQDQIADVQPILADVP